MIYALIDPSSGAVRYVGRTAFSARKRFRQHLRSTRGRTPVSRWIAGLVRSRSAPVLRELNGGSEASWIAKLKPDLNVRPGRSDPMRAVTIKNYNLNAPPSAVDVIEAAAAIEGERFPGRWILREAVARAKEVIAKHESARASWVG